MNKVYISCMRLHRNSRFKYVFPDKNDYDYIKFDQIVTILPDPVEYRGIFEFADACF